MTPASELLCAFVLDRSGDEPVAKRVALYRALASTLPGRSPRFRELTALADELAAIDLRCRQLRLDLGDTGSAQPFSPEEK